jgi:hypothetical protein
MASDQGRLTARARLLSYPPLWCWEIVDHGTGTVVASSWEGASEAYESASEALREAAPELLRLARRAPGDSARGRAAP